MQRSRFISFAVSSVLTGLIAALSLPAAAQGFPSKTIRIVVPTGTGTASDATARYLAEGMAKALNTPVIVDNKPGAGGVIGTEAVAKAPADGHTLLLTFSTHYINQWTTKLPYHALNDFEPIARLNRSALVLTTATSSPFKSLADVVAAARQNPDKLSYASASGVTEMAGALMANSANIRINHVLYKEPARVLIDASSGVADIAISGMTAAFPLVDGGRLRALAVTTATRSSRLPNVPTVAEAGLPGYELSSSVMVFAPKGTPAPVVARLSSVITNLAAADAFKDLCRIQVCDVEIQDAAGLKAAAPIELESWRRVVELTKARSN